MDDAVPCLSSTGQRCSIEPFGRAKEKRRMEIRTLPILHDKKFIFLGKS